MIYNSDMRRLKLWEWITCLAVVGFVGAVLFPVYACACKRATPATACLSNVKQLATALIIYTSDYDDRLPNRDRWMDAISHITKNPRVFIDPEIKTEEQYGYAFDSHLSNRNVNSFKKPEQHSMLYDSINLARNASDPFNSLPNPGRHKGKNSIAYLDGHAKRIAWPELK